jgi:DNA modification methylase
MINLELENLGPELDIDLLGLKDFVIEPIEKFEPQAGEDEVPEVIDPITKKGDIWLLGNHRVMCGDSTMIDDVERLMKGAKIDLVYTDPPYGINEKCDRVLAGRNGLAKSNSFDQIKNDDSTECAVDAYNLCEGLGISRQVWWGANYYAHSIPQSNNWIVWDKRVEENQKDVNSDCELAFVKSKWSSIRIFRHLWKGMIKASEHGQARAHPTQKPIALAEWVFDYYKEGIKNVMDLFLGSGSTLIACEKTNRKCYGMELDEKYCDVIVNRWQNYTGKEATLELSGETYNSLKE